MTGTNAGEFAISRERYADGAVGRYSPVQEAMAGVPTLPFFEDGIPRSPFPPLSCIDDPITHPFRKMREKDGAPGQRRQATARWSWNPASQPDWLTQEFYKNQIQPKLTSCSLSQIAAAIGVSILYASDIRRGRGPHPRHWSRLAELVGIS